MIGDPARLREFAVRYTAAWCGQDAAKVAACYSPDGSLTINDGAPAKGRIAITESARSFMTDFPDLQVLMDDLIVEDDRTEYHWTLIGANTGPGGTGKRVRIPRCRATVSELFGARPLCKREGLRRSTRCPHRNSQVRRPARTFIPTPFA